MKKKQTIKKVKKPVDSKLSPNKKLDNKGKIENILTDKKQTRIVPKSRKSILTKEAQKDLEKQEAELDEMEKTDLYEITVDEGDNFGACPFVPGKQIKYKPEYCELMVRFFLRVKRRLQLIKTYHKPDHRLDGKDISMLVTGEMAGPIKSVFPKEKTPMFPTFQRFCTDIGITRQTLYNWMKEYIVLFDTYNYCKELQHAILLEGTMLGLYKDNFSQFLLKNDFEYKDERAITIDDKTVGDPEEEDEDSLKKRLAEIRKNKILVDDEE